MAEEDEDNPQQEQQDTSGQLTGPEGILMLCIAGILDGIGIALFFLSWMGVDDYGILDVLGMMLIGGWMWFRSGELNERIVKKGIRRFATAAIVELVPVLGSVSPSWVILVYQELKG